MSLKRTAGKIFDAVTDKLDDLSEKIFGQDPLMIQAYRGYGRPDRIYLRGRVQQDEGVEYVENQRQTRNFLNNLRRFETDEIPDVDLKITFAGNEFMVRTDSEGYYRLEADLQHPIAEGDERWRTATVTVVQAPGLPDATGYSVDQPVFFPDEEARIGIISDMDDTVLQTHVASRLKLKMLWVTFFGNAYLREPLERVPELYRALKDGPERNQDNPVFYVSAGPWNIYDMLTNFLEHNDIPKGPLFLQDFGRPNEQMRTQFANHKLDEIGHILDMYPHLNFIMLGDTSGHDADNYIELSNRYPDRIKAVYIRTVGKDKKDERVRNIVEATTHIDVQLVHNTDEIEAHARAQGWIE